MLFVGSVDSTRFEMRAVYVDVQFDKILGQRPWSKCIRKARFCSGAVSDTARIGRCR